MESKRRGDPLGGFFGELAERFRGDRWQPATDVIETEKALVVRLELAGVRIEDLRVTVEGDVVRVSGVRTPPATSDVQRLHQMEIAFGPFERTLHVNVPFEREGVSAHLEDGFLTVTLPKRLPQRRRIEIER
ncbi:MAG TPA: Hsp20/alpha crystallin family protein [Myxococcota bacterium]|nr:Hsp20/alpha crystallin family protein [Myxococcota bacterium]